MESRRNLRVVPSNAPVLSENEDNHFNNDNDCRVCGLLHACSTCFEEDHGARACKKGILRVSSGNVGTSELALSHTESKAVSDEDHTFKTSQALINAPDYSAQYALKLEHRKKRRGLDSLSRLPLYYRSELQSQRYLHYRAKARSKDKWPDHIEDAFQEALRLYPRQGRKKLLLKGKQSGGNEFITHHIMKRTGVERTRKQVSSHIQVLKGFLKDNVAWMNLVAANGYPEQEGEKRQEIVMHEETTARRTRTIHGSLYHTHTNRSHYVSTIPLSPAETFSIPNNQYPTIRRVDFSMKLYERSTKMAFHTYTSIQSVTTSAPKPLDDVKDWRVFYPQLAEDHNQGLVDCPIFLFDASFSLMDDFPGCSASLTIDNSLDFTNGLNYTDWESHTIFYERKGQLVDLAKFYEANNVLENSWRRLECNPIARTNDARVYELPLKSKWWAKVFSKMIDQKHKARATGDPQAVKIEEENAERYLRGVSVMQEIHATPRARESKPQRLAILLWKFSKVPKGDTATTSWRNLIPAVSSFKSESPALRPLQSPLELDDTPHETKFQRRAGPYMDYYNPQQQPSIFAENAENLQDVPLSGSTSPATTPSLDYTSFPSSASSSFPTDISNSAYSSQIGPEACFNSQESLYTSLGSYDSQESQYHSHNHEICDSQESLYQTQETLYPPNVNEAYQWSPPHTFLPNDVVSSQEFTSCNIQISYPPPDEPLQGYGSHLIAPRVNAAPQHQVIQHPEQFDHHDYLEPDLQSQQGHESIDWQLIESQPIQVPDLRFHENELDESVLREYEQYQNQMAAHEEVNGHGQTQGQVLGEVHEEMALEARLEEYQ